MIAKARALQLQNPTGWLNWLCVAVWQVTLTSWDNLTTGAKATAVLDGVDPEALFLKDAKAHQQLRAPRLCFYCCAGVAASAPL